MLRKKGKENRINKEKEGRKEHHLIIQEWKNVLPDYERGRERERERERERIIGFHFFFLYSNIFLVSFSCLLSVLS